MNNTESKSILKRTAEFIKDHEALLRDLMDSLAILILCLYPFRNIHKGLDLWDTGYNLSNFEFMGRDHMDPMWLFSTYLANAIGHLLNVLPYGHTLLGMNFYTSFVPALMAFFSYVFFTRTLKVPGWIVFLGEFAALSMCWSPTVALYHYLTYMIITFSVLLLYRGLTENEYLTIAVSGGLCGLGVFVRFSNLPQASLILAIWLFGIFEFREALNKSDGVKIPSRVDTLGKTITRGICFVAGYAVAFLIFFVYLGLRYGFGEYLEGITELFGISETAEGYGTKEMIVKLVKSYTDQLYWVIRLLVFAVLGGLVYWLAYFLNERFGKKEAGNAQEKALKLLIILVKILGVLLSADAVAFLIIRKFVTYKYTTYWSCFALAGLMTFIALVAGIVYFFHRKLPAKSRLLAVLAVYCLLISAIGGNNGNYSAYNNGFIWMPFMLIAVWELIKNVKFPWFYGLKCVLCAVMLFFFVQSSLFGFNFAFSETDTGASDKRTAQATPDTLRGIRMSEEKAECLSGLDAYLEEAGLKDRELFVYGEIPGLPFYLQMAPAFNPWPDLDSFTLEKMEAELKIVSERANASENGAEVGKFYEKPVIIISVTDGAARKFDEEKWKLVYDYIEHENYVLGYSDTMFMVYR